jgi:hypothetical protein
MGRVGVWNADGIAPPLILDNRDHLPELADLRQEIELLLAKGQNPHPPETSFNDASLRVDRLSPLTSGKFDNLSVRDSDIKVAEGITVSTIIFDGARYNDTNHALLIVEVRIMPVVIIFRVSKSKPILT